MNKLSAQTHELLITPAITPGQFIVAKVSNYNCIVVVQVFAKFTQATSQGQRFDICQNKLNPVR